MKELSSIEKNLNILFPQSYKNTLDKFKSFMEIEFKDYEIDLFNRWIVKYIATSKKTHIGDLV